MIINNPIMLITQNGIQLLHYLQQLANHCKICNGSVWAKNA